METKREIAARINEIDIIINSFGGNISNNLLDNLEARRNGLQQLFDSAEEDTSSSIIRSHKAICEVKNMPEKAAYGNQPAVYYSLAIAGEAGELANKIAKNLRNGLDELKILEAVKSELPDVIIYSHVLAYVLDIDLTKLVNEKVEIVIQRAYDGYYGGPIPGLDKNQPTVKLNDELQPYVVKLMLHGGCYSIGNYVWAKDVKEAYELGNKLYSKMPKGYTGINVEEVHTTASINECNQMPIEKRITAETFVEKASDSNGQLQPFEIIITDDAGNRRIGDIVWTKDVISAYSLGSKLYPHDQYPNIDIHAEIPISTMWGEYDQIPVEERITAETLSAKQVSVWDPSLRPWEFIKTGYGDTDTYVEGVVWAKNEQKAYEIATRLFPNLGENRKDGGNFSVFVREAPIFRIKKYNKIPFEKRIIEKLLMKDKGENQ